MMRNRRPATAVGAYSISCRELGPLNYLYCFQNIKLNVRDTKGLLKTKAVVMLK